MTEKAYLHDARITAIAMDIENRGLRVHLTRFPDAEAPERIQSVIEFRNVQSFSGVLNFVAMESNAWAGNVEDWEPVKVRGVTHLYFVRGTLSVDADEPLVT